MSRRQGRRHIWIAGKYPASRCARENLRLLSRNNGFQLVLGFPPRRAYVPAHAVVQRQRWPYTPAILRIQPEIAAAGVERRLLSLLVVHRRADEKVGEVESGFRSIECEAAIVGAIGDLRDLVKMNVSAELDGMRAHHLRIIVEQLISVVGLTQGIRIDAETEIIQRNIRHAFKLRRDRDDAQSVRSRFKSQGGERWAHASLRFAREACETHVMQAQLVHRSWRLRLNVTQVDHLRPTHIQNIESRQGHSTVGTLLAIVIEKVVSGQHAGAAVPVDADAALVVTQHVVVCAGFKERLTIFGGIRLWDVLKKRLGRGGYCE